jgi:hypothetical protein
LYKKVKKVIILDLNKVFIALFVLLSSAKVEDVTVIVLKLKIKIELM